MENTLVSSRIARAKKDAGVAVLDSIGLTTSDLINSAFDYVIEKHQLPNVKEKARPQKRSLAKFIAESTLDIDWSGETRSYKEILRSGKAADYESLA